MKKSVTLLTRRKLPIITVTRPRDAMFHQTGWPVRKCEGGVWPRAQQGLMAAVTHALALGRKDLGAGSVPWTGTRALHALRRDAAIPHKWLLLVFPHCSGARPDSWPGRGCTVSMSHFLSRLGSEALGLQTFRVGGTGGPRMAPREDVLPPTVRVRPSSELPWLIPAEAGWCAPSPSPPHPLAVQGEALAASHPRAQAEASQAHGRPLHPLAWPFRPAARTHPRSELGAASGAAGRAASLSCKVLFDLHAWERSH